MKKSTLTVKKRTSHGSSVLKKKALGKDVWTLAVERMKYVFQSFDTVCVSCSGGKDSTAAMQVCLEAARAVGKLPLHVYFVDEEVIPPDVDEYMLRLRANPDIELHWICVPLVYFNNSDSEDKWYTWDPAMREKWVKPIPQYAITDIPGYDPEKSRLGASHVVSIMMRDLPGRVALVLGIRAGESLTRYRSVSRKEHENYIVRAQYGDNLGGLAVKNTNMWKVYPIYDWSDEDVWTAPQVFGWDYCKAYDKMSMAGLATHDQRISPPFGSYSARSLWTWHECWPEMWDVVMERVKGVHASAMYAKSSLYGKAGLRNVRKPNDMTWEEYIRYTVNKINDPDLKKIMSKQVNMYIRAHYRLSGGMPILPYAPHPDTGTCWAHLYRIVSRKDKDARDMPSLQVVPPNNKKKYQQVMAAYLEDLRQEYLT